MEKQEDKTHPQQVKPSGRGGATLTTIGKENTYLLVGGGDRQPMEFGDLWLLKVVGEETGDIEKIKFGWKKLPDEDQFKPRTGHSAVYDGGYIWIFGGQSFRQNSHTNELWRFNCETYKIERLETQGAPKGRNSHGCCVDPKNHQMYVYGGANDQGLLKDFFR